MLKGLWLKEAGFDIGDYISVTCEEGKIIITQNAERVVVKAAEEEFMEREIKLYRSAMRPRKSKYGFRWWRSRERGGNHLAKILAKKCCGKLYEVTEKQKRPVFEEKKTEELYGEILMSAKAPKKEGKGYGYPVVDHLVGLEGKVTGDRRKLLCMAGF